MRVNENIRVEDARIGFRNFSGKEGQYNPAGRRNFCVFFDPEDAIKLEEDGWNIRWLEPKNEGDDKQAYLQVAVNFGQVPPKMVLISSKGKTVLNEDNIELLDWAEIKTVDLVIRPYNWVTNAGTRNEKSGVKAYIKSMYVVIEEDEFESKYYDVPDSASGTIGGCGHCEECDGHCHDEH